VRCASRTSTIRGYAQTQTRGLRKKIKKDSRVEGGLRVHNKKHKKTEKKTKTAGDGHAIKGGTRKLTAEEKLAAVTQNRESDKKRKQKGQVSRLPGKGLEGGVEFTLERVDSESGVLQRNFRKRITKKDAELDSVPACRNR